MATAAFSRKNSATDAAVAVPLVRSLSFTVARIVLGVIFVAHGWQKVSTNGLDATAEAFRGMDVPLPTASAWYAGIVELVGGGLLIVGLAIPLVSVLLILDMLGALFTQHIDKGIWVTSGGWEFVAALAAGTLAVAFASHAPFSLDSLVKSRFKR